MWRGSYGGARQVGHMSSGRLFFDTAELLAEDRSLHTEGPWPLNLLLSSPQASKTADFNVE